MPPRHGTGRNEGPGKLLGTNADQRGKLPRGAFNYTPTRGGPGKWTNRAGTQIGESDAEDSTIRGRKSTGDVPLSIGAIKKYRKTRLPIAGRHLIVDPVDVASTAGKMLGHAVGNAAKYLGL